MRIVQAPEMHAGWRYTAKVDVWALGTILYELFTGKMLMNEADYLLMIRDQTRPKAPYALVYTLLYLLLRHLPKLRNKNAAVCIRARTSRHFRDLLENMLDPKPRVV